MYEYNVHLKWQRDSDDFDYQTYNRKHSIHFYGGPKIEVSSAPDLYRNPQFQSPEELFIASVSSCFMLTFLSLAAKKNITVDNYIDDATCYRSSLVGKQQAITEITLRPIITFPKNRKPDEKSLNQLVKSAHDRCFIANSIIATITVNPLTIETGIE